jgi:hypothetical protein
MRLLKLCFLAFLAGVFVCGFAQSALAQAVQVDNNPPSNIALRNVTVRDGKVSGEIVNTFPHDVRDVQLFIRRTWLWKNEFKPGPTADDPSTAEYVTISKELKHGQSEPFSYSLPSHASRMDKGQYMTGVSVAGFTEVIYPKS